MSQFGIYFVASKDRMRQWIDLDKLIAKAEEQNSPDIESIGSQQDELEGQMSAAKVYLDDVFGTEIELLLQALGHNTEDQDIEDLFHEESPESGPWWMQVNDDCLPVIANSTFSDELISSWSKLLQEFYGVEYPQTSCAQTANELRRLCGLASSRGEHLFYLAVV